MKANSYYLLLVLAVLVFGCHKEHDDLPIEPGNGINYVIKIDTVKVIHISSDTSYVLLSPLEGAFVPPVHIVTIDDIFEKTFDSLYLSIPEDNKIEFDSGVILPNITFSVNAYDPFTFPYYTVKIKSYQTNAAFPSPIPPVSFRDTTSNREINGYTLKRRYRRITFIADIELTVQNKKENTFKFTGLLKGSKVVHQYYDINLY